MTSEKEVSGRAIPFREATTSQEDSEVGHFEPQNSFSQIRNIGICTEIDIHLQDHHQTYLA